MSEVNLSTDETRVSYGIGRQLGDQLRDNPPPGVSLDAILAGLTDAFAGKPSRVDQEQMAASFKVIREIMQAEAAAKAEYVLPQVCVSGAKTFVGTNGQEYTCKDARVTPWECLENQDDYHALDGKQYTCEELKAARAKVGRGPGFFGFAAIALAASAGAAAAALDSNGRPASP